VYLLHGEDDFEIFNFIKAVKSKLGDETIQDMNVTWVESSKFDLESLRSLVSAVPFLAARRVVIFENASKKIKKKDLQEKFQHLLNSIQPSTALLLIENSTLKPQNWLLKWAQKASEHSFIRNFPVKNRGLGTITLPKGGVRCRQFVGSARYGSGNTTPLPGVQSKP
jgi:DNA polymerase III delta subunit